MPKTDTVTVRSLEFKQVSLPRPNVEDAEISGREKDEQPNAREQAAFSGQSTGGHVVVFENGTAEVTPAVAEQLTEHYPKSVFVVDTPAKG